jgi:hypothetical protein
VTSSLAGGRAQEANMACKEGAVVILFSETLSGREEDGTGTWGALGVEIEWDVCHTEEYKIGQQQEPTCYMDQIVFWMKWKGCVC